MEMHEENIVVLESIHKSFPAKSGAKRVVLDNVTMSVNKGEWVAIQGPSGSGKTTLLNIIYGSVTPDHGRVIIDGVEITNLTEFQRQKYRISKMGLVLQDNVLLPHLTAFENVLVPAYYTDQLSNQEIIDRAEDLLTSMGLEDKKHKYPAELSGGEQQRVAIARALLLNPPIILADEPTGHLDLESTDLILDLLSNFHQQGLTIILVTHSSYVAKKANRVVYLHGGMLSKQPLSVI